MCLSPLLVKVPRCKGSSLSKPVTVGCGKCLQCLQKRAANWTFRLLQEQKQAISSTFLTLTYDQENCPTVDGFMVLHKPDFQKYIKRVRQATKNKIKYYAVGEYGEKTRRPHYHAIIFNAENEVLQEKWQKGFVTTDKVTQASIHYVTGYLTKKLPYESKFYPSFSTMSKNLGISYIDRAKKYHKENMTPEVIYPGGKKGIIPRYYRERIFTDDELEYINEVMRVQAITNQKSLKEREVKALQLKQKKSFKNSKI